MKIIYQAIYMLLIGYFTSCNFEVNTMPGPQISTSIQWSQKHNAFICEYKVKGDVINGQRIESVFAERRYNLSEGLFGKYTVDCCTAQVIVISDSVLDYPTLNDIPQKWEIVGFGMFSSYMLVKKYNTVEFPDKLIIQVRPDVKSSVVQNVVLYKVEQHL